MLQAFFVEYAKPYLNHVKPGTVKRSEVDYNPFVFPLKPLTTFKAGFEGIIGYIT